MPKVKRRNADFQDNLPWLTRLLDEIEHFREREHIQPSLPFAPAPDSATEQQTPRPLGKRHPHAGPTTVKRVSRLK